MHRAPHARHRFTLGWPSRPAPRERRSSVLPLRVHTPDGDDCGELQTLAPNWKVDETFLTGDGRRLRIVAMLPLREDYPESVFDGVDGVQAQPKAAEVVTLFRVRLAKVLHGSTCGSTDDLVEAECADDAEPMAIEQWSAADPSVAYQALVTTQID